MRNGKMRGFWTVVITNFKEKTQHLMKTRYHSKTSPTVLSICCVREKGLTNVQ